MFRTIATTVALGLAVCACNSQGGITDPRVGGGVSSPSLDSGVTSSNGGGTRSLGNNPNVSVGTGAAAEPRQAPNSRGPAY